MFRGLNTRLCPIVKSLASNHRPGAVNKEPDKAHTYKGRHNKGTPQRPTPLLEPLTLTIRVALTHFLLGQLGTAALVMSLVRAGGAGPGRR